MKKEKDIKLARNLKKDNIRTKLLKKIEQKNDNSKLFGSTFTSDFNSINKGTRNTINLKMSKIKKPKNFNLTNQSFIKDSNVSKNNITTDKSKMSIGYNTYRNNQIKKNDNKLTSSFYITQEEKNKRNKMHIKNTKNMMLNISMNEKSKNGNINRKNILGNILTHRNNINTNKVMGKEIISKRKGILQKEIKINKNENETKNKDRKNKFERSKTLGKLKNQKNEEQKKSKGKSLNKKEQNHNEKKLYSNLYDKYLEQFKEKLQKIANNNNYKTDEELKIKKPSTFQNFQKKEMLKKYQTQTNFFKRNIDQKNKIDNNNKKTKELPKKQVTKIKFERRKVGKSVGVKRNIEKTVNKENKTKIKNNNKKENKTENTIDVKIPTRSKSMTKLTDRTKKNINDEKYDIDYILYGKINPPKYEDPFDDIDSIVKYINFDKIKINVKNIFSVEDNEKYENYSKKFDNLFNKALSNNQRNSIEKDETNKTKDNNINLIQNEKTTDSFKKNKINISFIENQNN